MVTADSKDISEGNVGTTGNQLNPNTDKPSILSEQPPSVEEESDESIKGQNQGETQVPPTITEDIEKNLLL